MNEINLLAGRGELMNAYTVKKAGARYRTKGEYSFSRMPSRWCFQKWGLHLLQIERLMLQGRCLLIEGNLQIVVYIGPNL